MKLTQSKAIMKSIWKIQIKVVKSVSISRYQHSTKLQILDILSPWKPKKNDKFEFGKLMFIPASHQTKIIESRVKGDNVVELKYSSMIDHLVHGHGHTSQVTVGSSWP